METTLLFILLLLIMWISLHSNVGKAVKNTEKLQKELEELKKLLKDKQQVPQPDAAVIPEKKTETVIRKEEEYHIPILSVEIRQEEEHQPVKDKVQQPEMVIPVPPSVRPSKPKKECTPINYEKYIGENLFGKIGILILVVGVGLFVKYAIDKEWINEVFRTVLGFAVGGALLLISGKLRHTYRTFSSLLAGGAFAIFYVTVAMAYHYYGLFNQTTAFVILVLLTVFMSVLSILYNRRELAIFALAGGFIAPFLVSNGMGSYLVLFSYVSILNIGMFGLALYKKWGELPIVCFVATYLILLGYALATDLDVATNTQLVHLLLFSTLYYLIFLLPVVCVIQADNRRINQLLMGVIILNNFIYLFFSLWFLRDLQLEQNVRGAFTLFIALVNAVLACIVYKRKMANLLLSPALISLALTFISITIPIQLEGTFITLMWACEMLIVLWLYCRMQARVYKYFAYGLVFLTASSYLIDIESMFGDEVAQQLFINGMFATGIWVGASFLLFSWLLNKEKVKFQLADGINYHPFSAVTLLMGCAALYTACMLELGLHISNALLSQKLMMTFTAIALLVLLLLLRKRFLVAHHPVIYACMPIVPVGWYFYSSLLAGPIEGADLQTLQWLTCVVIIAHLFFLGKTYYVAFNYRAKSSNGMTCYLCILSTIMLALAVNNLLTGFSLYDETNAGLSISLTIAGFVEMALGMRLHLKPLRMISLATFGLVLVKLVAVDLWLLPTVGKIIIFIILGVILLLLSFLYQKLKRVLFEEDKEEMRRI